jgi:hypothetical protein
MDRVDWGGMERDREDGGREGGREGEKEEERGGHDVSYEKRNRGEGK